MINHLKRKAACFSSKLKIGHC